MLLASGASIEEPNDESYTPIMEAAREGHAVSEYGREWITVGLRYCRRCVTTKQVKKNMLEDFKLK